MPRVADYSIIADGWVWEGTQTSIKFEVPANIDAGSRSVLGFMLKTYTVAGVKLSVRLNGKEVWNWSYGGGGSDVSYFQEVIDAGLVKPGTNVFSFHCSSPDARNVELSDIVLWWQANI